MSKRLCRACRCDGRLILPHRRRLGCSSLEQARQPLGLRLAEGFGGGSRVRSLGFCAQSLDDRVSRGALSCDLRHGRRRRRRLPLRRRGLPLCGARSHLGGGGGGASGGGGGPLAEEAFATESSVVAFAAGGAYPWKASVTIDEKERAAMTVTDAMSAHRVRL
mmetsp:Transcript_33957/g.100852  ORF Transcript_33957/g.100852 Transcript_33957/m.100852 type:complete len:163 (+) Transcript_33957:633-1121(+)